MKIRGTVGFAVVLAAASCLFAVGVSAQPPRQSPPLKLSLKLIHYEGAAPTFYPVGDDDGASMGAEVRSFRRLSNMAASGAERISLLTLLFVREGARVRVSVYVNSEDGATRASRKIAELLIAEGREYAVTQLSGFGIEPLLLGVIRREDEDIAPPRVDNRTHAVAVTAVEVHERVPSFELTLKNTSDKKIRAVEIQEMRSHRWKGSPVRFDWKGMALIKPGEVWKVTLEFGWNHKTTEGVHSVEPPDRIIVRTVLFSDGSYEGDPIFAATAEAFKAGRRNLLARALDILRARGESHGVDAREATRALAAEVAALECNVEWSAVVELAGRYPYVPNSELEEIKTSIEAGMGRQRAMLLSELESTVKSLAPEADTGNLSQWVKARSELYEKQLAEI